MAILSVSRLCLRTLLLTAAAVTLVSCSRDDDDRLASELAPPERVDVLAPPVAPDPSQMHPALAIARSRGLKTNVYFNEELQQAVARLNGMEETLGRLQGDLQGTAMAMQRVAMMRQEIDALNVRFQSLQERLMYAGPVMAPEGAPLPVPPVTRETVTTVTTTVPAEAPVMPNPVPTPLMGDLADPKAAAQNPQIATAQMKPVVEGNTKAKTDTEKASAQKEPVKKEAVKKSGASGVNDVRIGTHDGSVRIVLDVGDADAAFTTNLDAGEKLLTVELPNTKWAAAAKESIRNNPLVSSYSAQAQNGGSVIAFSLKGDTKIIKSATLKNPTRVMIDLAR